MHSALHCYQSRASHIFLLKFYHYFNFFFPWPLIHSISFSFLTSSLYLFFSVPFSLGFFHFTHSIFVYYFLFLSHIFPVFPASPFSYPHTFAIFNVCLSFNIAHGIQLRILHHPGYKGGKSLLSFQVINQTHLQSDNKTLTPNLSVKCKVPQSESFTLFFYLSFFFFRTTRNSLSLFV
jgi:hypothetical protein